MAQVVFAFYLLLVFTIPWENAIIVDGWGTLTRVLGMILGALWLVSVLAVKHLRRPHRFHVFTAFFVVWNAATVYWSVDPDLTVQRSLTHVQLLFLSWVIWDSCRTPHALRTVMQTYVLGAYITIGSTVLNFYSGATISSYEVGRYSGSGLNAVDLVLLIALGLPLSWHLASTSGKSVRGRVLRVVNYAFIPAALLAMALTGSRTAIFVCVPAAIYIIGIANRRSLIYQPVVAAFLAGVVIAVMIYIPEATMQRLLTVGQSISDKDLGGRVDMWRAFTDVFFEAPVIGIGSGVSMEYARLGGVAHNIFLSVMIETGIVGLSLLMAVLAIVVREAGRQERRWSMLWMTVLATWFIGVLTLSWESTKGTWFFLSLVVAASGLPRSVGDRLGLSQDWPAGVLGPGGGRSPRAVLGPAKSGANLRTPTMGQK